MERTIAEIKQEIDELARRANLTDSKKEDFECRQRIRELRRQIEEDIDSKINKFPEEITLHCVIDQKIKFDTFDFKNWLQEYIEDNGIDNVNMEDEFQDWLRDNFDPANELDLWEYKLTIVKDGDQ